MDGAGACARQRRMKLAGWRRPGHYVLNAKTHPFQLNHYPRTFFRDARTAVARLTLRLPGLLSFSST